MVTQSTNQKTPKHLSPLNTSWHNRSMSSLSATSDAATFHSAHAHPQPLSSHSNMELRPLSQQQSQPQLSILSMTQTNPLPSPKLEAIRMNRQDSGYSDTPASPATSSHRRSESSTRPRDRNSSPSKPKRRTTGSSANSARPSTKRASKSSAQVRASVSGPSGRPSLQGRHTTPYAHTSHHSQPYQFFQFPTFSSPSTEADALAPPPPPPPATVQYWTSDSTRRLEYAAIDAASKGVRGFFIKLVPDCILPKHTRRTRFCDGDEGSDAGSVRRYRLQLPEEKGSATSSAREDDMGKGCDRKPSLFRRWTGLGRVRS